MNVNLLKISMSANNEWGGVKALADASIKNASFFYLLPFVVNSSFFYTI